MEKITWKPSITEWVLIVSIVTIVIMGIYGHNRFKKISENNIVISQNIDHLSQEIISLQTKLASTTSDLSVSIKQNHVNLSNALDKEIKNVGNIEQKLGSYQKEVGSVSNTVTTLQKLSKTDPQLLQKYSKVFFLNEYYAPVRLDEIPKEYIYGNTKILKIQADVWSHLKNLFDNAKKDNIELYAFSAYRSFNEQSALKKAYAVTYGAGSANQFSADQGYSEHQIGTTLDFITTGLGGNLEGFEKTKAYTWLNKNAYKYGFVISYPENNKFYVFEPWHWRYVGIKLATDLYDANARFYDWDQRKIDEYLVNIFE